MSYVIRNIQEPLDPGLGCAYPSLCWHLGVDGEWTSSGPLMQFDEKSHAEDAIKDGGWNVGRNEFHEKNRVNIVEVIEV